MNTIGERIARKREAAGLNQSELGRRLGVTPQAVQKWESGISTPRNSKLGELASTLGTTVSFLVDGQSPATQLPLSNAQYLGPIDAWDDDTPLADDEVYVPFLKEVELAAGSGRTAVQQSSDRRLRFGKITLRNQGVTPSDAVCVTVSGNSMEPVLPNGSTVGVNRGCTKVIDGKMYALDHNGELRVKTLHRLPGGGIRLRSFNQTDYEDESYTLEQMTEQNLQILGRVFWSSALW